MRGHLPDAPPGKDAVVVEGLGKDFGGDRRIGPLHFRVPAGSVTGFVGPNGAGKTTTVRMLLGLVAPTSGTARVLGHDLADRAAHLPSVGALVEGPALYDGLSGRRNLLVHARLGGIPTSRVDEVLDQTGLGGRGKERVRRYSLGMRQRLAIATALLPRPRLLVLDEPANGLDPQGIIWLRGLLRDLAADGVSSLVSSHLLGEIEHTCDHLVVLHDGRVRFEGASHDLHRAASGALLLRPENPGDLGPLAALVAGLGHQARRGERDGCVHVTAPPAASAEINRASADAGITLAELVVRSGLEDTFLAMTTADTHTGKDRATR
ncbi:ATP-binding cassette domain-containing protein [Streptomyces sp. NPDC058576]|uniref:ATP-binding cassette domain-containing protein n=1 Tax=Streptomyces sp. NPDC058576 TaxID=3346547 RepID=UPI0036695B12